MILLLFLSLIITTFQASSSNFSQEIDFSSSHKNLRSLRLTPNASPIENNSSPVFSDRTHKPDHNQMNSLEGSPQDNLLSPLLARHTRHLSACDDNKESCSIITISDKDPKDQSSKNSLTDCDKNEVKKSDFCPKTILGYERNKIIIASVSLTLFAGGIACLFLIKH